MIFARQFVPAVIEDAGQGRQLDQAILQCFSQTRAWGISTGIDLFECDPQLIRDEQHIRQFTADLCAFLQMKTYGPCTVVRFGGPDVCGYSMTQLIETSLVSAHFIEKWNAACIDLFSCAAYEPHQAAEFCREVFHARWSRVAMHVRGVAPLLMNALLGMPGAPVIEPFTSKGDIA